MTHAQALPAADCPGPLVYLDATHDRRTAPGGVAELVIVYYRCSSCGEVVLVEHVSRTDPPRTELAARPVGVVRPHLVHRLVADLAEARRAPGAHRH